MATPLVRIVGLCRRRLGPENILDLNHHVRREPAVLSMAIDRLGAVRFVNAVELVARGIGAMPNVRHTEIFDDAVGFGGNVLELLSREFRGSGDIPFH